MKQSEVGEMNHLPKRKHIRIENYNYSTPGAYFITVCVHNRKPILWNVGAATCRPNLSKIGFVVLAEIALLTFKTASDKSKPSHTICIK